MIKKLPAKIKNVASIVSAVLVIGGAIGGFTGFVSSKIVSQIDQRIQPLADTITEVRLDTARLQLLQLIENDTENTEEILKVARHYFVDLGGDWYMTAIFNEWCMERDIHVDWEMPL